MRVVCESVSFAKARLKETEVKCAVKMSTGDFFFIFQLRLELIFLM